MDVMTFWERLIRLIYTRRIVMIQYMSGNNLSTSTFFVIVKCLSLVFQQNIRLSIKIILLPVKRPGGLKRCDWRLFFPIFFFFFPKMDKTFLPKKKRGKKKIAAVRLASISPTRWTGNKTFFYGQPKP